MHIDYLAEFPLPVSALLPKLRELLTPTGIQPEEQVAVQTIWEGGTEGSTREHLHMLMAVVPEDKLGELGQLREANDGVVEDGTPCFDRKADSQQLVPSISGYDYIIASWGNGHFYTFNLAEKVWMTLGLTPRCIGNDEQRLVYDDLRLPAFGVAEGEISARFHYRPSRNVHWRMSNQYLRKYLWVRGCVGVRSFYYKAICPENPELRELLNGKTHATFGSEESWYELVIQEYYGQLQVEVWASVVAVSCELSPEERCDGLIWPGFEKPVTSSSANANMGGPPVYLDDRFLARYETNSLYDTVPYFMYGRWHCSPSYQGQWSFTDCSRVGRNLIKVYIRELYKPKPAQEIVHAHAFAVDADQLAQVDMAEEHIVSKTHRLVAQILDLGDNLSTLGKTVGIEKDATDWVGFSRAEIADNGWTNYAQLSRLATAAPLSLSQQAFLSRCKTLHEVWQRVPDGLLRKLLEVAGCPKDKVKDLKSLKLLQALQHITQRLDEHHERADALKSTSEPIGWAERNENLAPLFLNNDLRIADAHDAVGLR